MALLLAVTPPMDPGRKVPEDVFWLDFQTLAVDTPLVNVTDLVFLPQDHEVLVIEKSGRVLHARIRDDGVTVLGSFTLPGVWDHSDCGLISGAIAPDFESSRHVYFAHCVSRTHSAIDRVRFEPDNYDAIPESRLEIFRAGDRRARESWHNAGDIGFYDDGSMWALFGEKTIKQHAANPLSELGALLRFRISDDGRVERPRGNPFRQPFIGSPNVYAIGLRAPFKGTLDESGRVWFGDVGANSVEEVNVVTKPGQNFGWPWHEGPCKGKCEEFAQPVVWWPHGPSQYIADDPDALPVPQRVVWVGLQYRGDSYDRYAGHLTGRVLFGDLCVGFVRSLQVDESGAIVADDPVGHLAHATAWGEGQDGYIYAVANGGCGAGTIGNAPTVFYRAVPH